MSDAEWRAEGRGLFEEAFITSAGTAVREMFSVEVDSRRENCIARARAGGDLICGSIRLAGPQPGELRIWLSEEVAERLAAKYTGATSPLTPHLVDDFAGELANVVAGQAKTILKGTDFHFQMTLPKVQRRSDAAVIPVLAELASELGSIWIELVRNLP